VPRLVLLLVWLAIAAVANAARAAEPAGAADQGPSLPPPLDAPAQAADEVRALSDWLGPLEANWGLALEPLPDGAFLLAGEYRDTNAAASTRYLARLEPEARTGRLLWRGNLGFFVRPRLWVCGNTVWFLVETPFGPVVWALDARGSDAWSTVTLFGSGLDPLPRVLREHPYYTVACDADDGLLLQWVQWEPLAILWGRTREELGLRPEAEIPGDPVEQRDVYSLVRLPPLAAALAEARKGRSLVPGFTASYQATLPTDPELTRPAPHWQGAELFFAPLHSGVSFGPLAPLAAPELGSLVQPFVLYRDPAGLAACGEAPRGSTVSAAGCARFAGAYLEAADSGRLLAILNLGAGVPGPAALDGRFFAQSASAEPPSSGFPPPGIGLWDLAGPTALARLVLYADEAKSRGGEVAAITLDGSRRVVSALVNFGRAGGVRLFSWHF